MPTSTAILNDPMGAHGVLLAPAWSSPHDLGGGSLASAHAQESIIEGGGCQVSSVLRLSCPVRGGLSECAVRGLGKVEVRCAKG